jgi:predicted DNA-binding protein YlxM (UPF0122 family)
MAKRKLNEKFSVNGAVNKNLVYYAVLERIHQFSYHSKKFNKKLNMCELADEIGISKQALNRYIKVLKENDEIDFTKNKFWILKKDWSEKRAKEVAKALSGKQLSLGTRGDSNLHALHINIPILEGQITGEEWEVREKLNNWIPKYTEWKSFHGVTLKNNNNKSLSIYPHSRDFKDPQEVKKLCYRLVKYITKYFANKGVILDDDEAETKNLDLATEDEFVKKNKQKGEKIKVSLGRDCEKIFPNDKRKADAWMDDSPTMAIETNDILYKRNYLYQPEYVKRIHDKVMSESSNIDSLKESMQELFKYLEVQAGLINSQSKIIEQNNEQIGLLIKERRLDFEKNKPETPKEELGKPDYLG